MCLDAAVRVKAHTDRGEIIQGGCGIQLSFNPWCRGGLEVWGSFQYSPVQYRKIE